MDFEFTEEQRDFQRTIRAFVEKEIKRWGEIVNKAKIAL